MGRAAGTTVASCNAFQTCEEFPQEIRRLVQTRTAEIESGMHIHAESWQRTAQRPACCRGHKSAMHSLRFASERRDKEDRSADRVARTLPPGISPAPSRGSISRKRPSATSAPEQVKLASVTERWRFSSASSIATRKG